MTVVHGFIYYVIHFYTYKNVGSRLLKEGITHYSYRRNRFVYGQKDEKGQNASSYLQQARRCVLLLYTLLLYIMTRSGSPANHQRKANHVCVVSTRLGKMQEKDYTQKQ